MQVGVLKRLETRSVGVASNEVERSQDERWAEMPKDEYLDQIHTRLRNWRQQIQECGDEAGLERKYDRIMHLLTSYQRLGAGAWAEEHAALQTACSDMEQALTHR